MTSRKDDKQTAGRNPGGASTRWLGIGGGVALALALLAMLVAWRHASDERRAAEDVKARVAAEMNRIEAEAQRIEREASK